MRIVSSLFSQEIQQTFKDKLIENLNMKFKDTCQNFLDTYGGVTEEEVKDSKDMLTAACQSHRGFEALVTHTETCLVHNNFAKKDIPDKDLINILLIVITQMRCYQVGYSRQELLPANPQPNWINTKF